MVVVQSCTTCTRNGLECLFTKKQLKRGPSKGYIKELERRLYSLENQRDSHLSSQRRDFADLTEVEDDVVEEEGPDKRRARTEHASMEKILQSAHDDGEEGEFSREDVRPLHTSAHDISKRDMHNNDEVDNFYYSCNAHLSSPAHSSPPERPDAGDSKGRGTEITAFSRSPLALCLPILDPDDLSDVDGLAATQEDMLVQALALLTDAVETESGSSPSSMSSSSSSAALPHHGRSSLSHDQALQLVIGRAIFDDQDGISPAAVKSTFPSPSPSTPQSSAKSLRAMQKMATSHLDLQADTLMLCYLDALRRGQANDALLAAAVAKSTMIKGPLSEARMGRRVVLMVMDRWHATGFHSRFHIPSSSITGNNKDHTALLHALPAASRQPQSVASVCLRAAMLFGLFRETLEACPRMGVRVANIDVEAMLRDMQLDDDSDASDGADNYGSQEMRPSIRNALRAYHALYQLAHIVEREGRLEGVITLESVDKKLQLIEGIMSVGVSGAVINAASQLASSYLSPVILSIASVLLSWLSRMITLKAREILTSTNSSFEVSCRLQTLEYLRRKIYGWLRLISTLCRDIDRPTEPCSFSLLHARVVLFANANVDYLSKIGDLGAKITSIDDLGASTPIREEFDVIRRDANGILHAFIDRGPLGSVLSTTLPGDAYHLLARTSST
ncbi:hypothetical protein CBS101457_001652 [Exobasidium rhododendri]|nr:hypothetical protein CBS101457_001652 [Exobasidium rhododendri]